LLAARFLEANFRTAWQNCGQVPSERVQLAE